MTEYVDVVDEEDRVIGKASREECHTTGKIHRVIHVLVVNSKGEVLLGKRTMDKKLYPGMHQDIGGHVSAGETYEESAERELEEELGIKCKLERIADVKKRFRKDNENVRVFICRYGGPVKFNKEDFTSAGFFSVGDIKEKLKKGEIEITPGTTVAFNAYYENLEV